MACGTPAGITTRMATFCFRTGYQISGPRFDDDRFAQQSHFANPLLRRCEQLVHRGLEELVPSRNARIVRPARRRWILQRFIVGVNVGGMVTIRCPILRLAADLRAHRVVVQEQRVCPG